ncbi:MAG: gentisate 1,2-dioxygenase [Candidimonas sp.]|nr:MAG: gentisate 1,2-dioxygenase [Candidimonas sp.]TAM20990.1 MAG: gentisate 1,2-dioxygenase [Candidimonas sp.]
MSDLSLDFENVTARLIDHSTAAPETNQLWAPVIITREEIEAECVRLTDLSLPSDGRRQSLIVHPMANPAAPGLAPGIRVTLSVLKPGESTVPMRHNATEVNFCIRGSGYTIVNGKRIDFETHDVWNHPSYAIYSHFNNSDQLQVRLTYSNVPLLQHMQVYIVDTNPPAEAVSTSAENREQPDARKQSPYGIFELGNGAMMMPYELLINPPAVESSALHWPWLKVKKELDKLEALGKDYIGRRLYLLYNPKTGGTNGTTPNFFATMTMRPPKIVDRPHRHVSAAINYYFGGTGYSTVAGNRYEWKAGDLMLSAPGWAVHNHASYDDFVYELTIQDQPLNILMESLLWQENLKNPPALLGTHSGFDTNRNKATL